MKIIFNRWSGIENQVMILSLTGLKDYKDN